MQVTVRIKQVQTKNRIMDFEKKLQEQLDKLPYKKHIDDGQYNDGQLDGFETGARWAFALFNVVGQSEPCGLLHSTDWNAKCFKCGEQVFVREPK